MSDPQQGYTPYDPARAGPVFDNDPHNPAYHQQYDQYQQYGQYGQYQQYPPPGQYTTPQPGYPAMGPQPQNGAGVTALVLGIMTFAGGCLPLGIGAIIAGHIGMNKARRGEADNYMFAKAGVIMGYIGVGIMLLIVLFYTVVIVIAVNDGGGS